MRKNSQLVENQLKSFLWTLYRFFRIISRKLDLVLKFVWFCLPKKFHPLFFGPCLSCLLGGEGRVRWNAWCEQRRVVCVVHEVSMCRWERGDFAHVCIVGCYVYLVGRVVFSHLSFQCLAVLCPETLCLKCYFVRAGPNQRVYFGGSVRLVCMRACVQGERTVRVFWS